MGLFVKNKLEFVLKEIVVGLDLGWLTERRIYKRIQSNRQSIVKHGRNDSCQHLAVNLKARVGVDLYQPAFKILVNHDVNSKYLKIVCLPLSVNKGIGCKYYVSCYLFYLGVYYRIETLIWILLKHVLIQLLI